MTSSCDDDGDDDEEEDQEEGDSIPDSNVHGANMGPIWGRQDPGGPQVGPINFAIWDVTIGGLYFVMSLNWNVL